MDFKILLIFTLIFCYVSSLRLISERPRVLGDVWEIHAEIKKAVCENASHGSANKEETFKDLRKEIRKNGSFRQANKEEVRNEVRENESLGLANKKETFKDLRKEIGKNGSFYQANKEVVPYAKDVSFEGKQITDSCFRDVFTVRQFKCRLIEAINYRLGPVIKDGDEGKSKQRVTKTKPTSEIKKKTRKPIRKTVRRTTSVPSIIKDKTSRTRKTKKLTKVARRTKSTVRSIFDNSTKKMPVAARFPSKTKPGKKLRTSGRTTKSKAKKSIGKAKMRIRTTSDTILSGTIIDSGMATIETETATHFTHSEISVTDTATRIHAGMSTLPLQTTISSAKSISVHGTPSEISSGTIGSETTTHNTLNAHSEISVTDTATGTSMATTPLQTTISSVEFTSGHGTSSGISTMDGKDVKTAVTTVFLLRTTNKQPGANTTVKDIGAIATKLAKINTVSTTVKPPIDIYPTAPTLIQ